jgi:hypothetical protein
VSTELTSHRLGPDERTFLLSVLDPRSTGPLTRAASLDWPALLAVASAANYISLLADRTLSTSSDLDAATRETLRSALEQTATHNTRILAELARSSALLQSAGIEHVALKGAVLLARHYPRITTRHTVDLDLLVDPKRFELAERTLRSAGYVDDPHYARTLVGDGTSLAQAWPERAHTCPPLKGPSGVTLDLHHRVPISDFESSGGFAGWLARSQRASVQGVQVPLCGPHDLTAHLCEHFVLQHHADPADAPRLLCDLRVLAVPAPDWTALRRGSASRRFAVLAVQRLYDAAFNAGAARDPLTVLLQRIAIAEPSVAVPLAELSHLIGHASRLSFNVRNRPSYALRSVFPTRKYMAQQYGIDPRSPRIYPLYVKRLFTKPLAPLLRKR